MPLCTWKDCPRKLATHDVADKNGYVWARLCDEHHKEFTASLDGIKDWRPGRTDLISGMLRAWAKAGGMRDL